MSDAMTTSRMHPAMMVLGYTKAVGRFVADEGTASLHDTLKLAVHNQHHPDIDGLLRATFGAGKEAPPPDLDEELTTLERYFALFEALNWAVSLDDRLAEDWPFEEISFGKYWCDDFAGGGLIRGLRSVRNAVHHDWSLAIDVDPLEIPFRQRIELLWLAWSEELLSDDRAEGATAYRENLAGRVVGDTLFEIGEVFGAATAIVSGGIPTRGTGPAKIKETASDLYRPEDPASSR